jgi:hypothetical protein
VTWKSKKINIYVGIDELGSSLVSIKAEVSGPFAIHPTWNDSPLFTLTHLGSGYRITNCVSVEAGKNVAEFLSDLNWSFTSPKVPRATLKAFKERHARLRALASGLKPGTANVPDGGEPSPAGSKKEG